MTQSYSNLIDGELVTTARTLEVINPATEEVIGQVPACGKAELDRAVAAARRAFKSWKATPVEDRRTAIRAMKQTGGGSIIRLDFIPIELTQHQGVLFLTPVSSSSTADEGGFA